MQGSGRFKLHVSLVKHLKHFHPAPKVERGCTVCSFIGKGHAPLRSVKELRQAPPVQAVNVEDDSDDDANNDSTNDNNDKIPRDYDDDDRHDDDGRAEPPTRI